MNLPSASEHEGSRERASAVARRVILGVTGSIAAHKAVDIASQLVKQGCEVRVVMTPDATRFVTPLPFRTLSRHPVITDLFEEEDDWRPSHLQVADEADLLLIAPATAHTIAKLAVGLAGDALSCIALALKPAAKVLIAPAMNGKMWLHAATQRNVATLKERGIQFIGPAEGLLACGYEGVGRLTEADAIVRRAVELLAQ